MYTDAWLKNLTFADQNYNAYFADSSQQSIEVKLLGYTSIHFTFSKKILVTLRSEV